MNILVTGATKGVGLAVSEAVLSCSPEGTVYAVARRQTKALTALAEAYPGRVKFKAFDLAAPEDIKATLFDDFVTHRVVLHGYVNNAATAYDDIITNLNLERLEMMYRVNVFSPFNITKYAIRNMLLHRTRGSIVHISSISVHTGYKGLAMYASTKGALEAFSKNTAREWGSIGVRSNCLVAGFMDTDMSASLSDEQKRRIYQRTALKQATQVESVAATTQYLLSSSSASITGQNIFVDSGTI